MVVERVETWYNRLPAHDLLSVLLWGEARGEPLTGIVAVANVVRNRVKHYRWSHIMKEVILQPYQFDGLNALGDEPFDPGEPFNTVARLCVYGLLVDNTGGATHFIAKGADAYWEKVLVPKGTIGNHDFYMEE